MYNVIGVILGQLISISNHYFSKNLKIKFFVCVLPFVLTAPWAMLISE